MFLRRDTDWRSSALRLPVGRHVRLSAVASELQLSPDLQNGWTLDGHHLGSRVRVQLLCPNRLLERHVFKGLYRMRRDYRSANHAVQPISVDLQLELDAGLGRNLLQQRGRTLGRSRGEPTPSDRFPLAALLLHEPERLLTVREVAEVLAVSTPIVYTLCERGELTHLRISNVIRVAPSALADYLARGI